MLTVMIYIMITFTMVSVINVIYLMIKNNFNNYRDKYSTFECGMDLMTSLRLPFSLHFYFISIVFLVFDVELMLILPFVFCFKLFNITNMVLMIYILLLFIILGFMYEWWTGLLDWMM